MCNPVRTFHCIIRDALEDAHLETHEYIEPLTNRETVEPIPMPLSVLRRAELQHIRRVIGCHGYQLAEANGLTENQRFHLALRDTDHANPQTTLYRRGTRGFQNY